MNQRILITGGCGFVGSSLAIKLKEKYPSYDILCFDNLKRRGSELNIVRLKGLDIKFIHGDVRNKEDFQNIGVIDTVIDAAAEPSVMGGLNAGKEYVTSTNLIGTINTLNIAEEHKADFVFLSSSRVYPIQYINRIEYEETATRFDITKNQLVHGITGNGITEDLPLEGARSLYGASKLSSEFLIAEYNHFWNIRTVINRCGVLTGPYQMGKVDQGFVVLWLAKHYWNKKLSYFGFSGSGKQVRDILHVEDLFNLVDWQIHNMSKVNGETFNVGGGYDNSISLCECTALCEEITGNSIEIEAVDQKRPGDIRIYISDNTKVNQLCNWTPNFTTYQILEDTYEWICQNENELSQILI